MTPRAQTFALLVIIALLLLVAGFQQAAIMRLYDCLNHQEVSGCHNN